MLIHSADLCVLRYMLDYAKTHPHDVNASPYGDGPVSDNEGLPFVKALRLDDTGYVQTTDLLLNTTSCDPSCTFNDPIYSTENTPGLASQIQSHGDTTSLYVLVLGTFPTMLLLLIVFCGIPQKARDRPTMHVKPGILNTGTVIYMDFLDRQRAPPSPESTDAKCAPSAVSDSAPATPTAPPTLEVMEAHVPARSNSREALLGEWEISFVSPLRLHRPEGTD